MFSDTAHLADDLVDVQNHLHHGDLVFVDTRVDFSFDFRLANVINRESQRDSCQRTCISGVASCDSLRGQAGSLSLGSAQQNNNVLCAKLLSKLLHSLLILQVHCASGGSDEALRRGEYYVRARSLRAFFDRGTWDAISIADDNNFLTRQYTHGFFLLLVDFCIEPSW